MKKAAVVIDRWKLPIFERHLQQKGYKWIEQEGETRDTLILKVDYDWLSDLYPVIEAANAECAYTHCPTCED